MPLSKNPDIALVWDGVVASERSAILIKYPGLQVIKATKEAKIMFGAASVKELEGILKKALSESSVDFLSDIGLGNQVESSRNIAIHTLDLDLRLKVKLFRRAESPIGLVIFKPEVDTPMEGVSPFGPLTELVQKISLPTWVLGSDGRLIFANDEYFNLPLEVRALEGACIPGAEGQRVALKDWCKTLKEQPHTLSFNFSVHVFESIGPSRLFCTPIYRERFDTCVAFTLEPLIGSGTLAKLDSSQSLEKILTAVREDEREGIARDIHDALGQELTVHKLSIYRLQSILQENISPAQEAQINILREQAETLISSAKRIAYGLNYGEKEEFLPRIRDLVNNFSNRSGLTGRLEVMPGWENPNGEKGKNIYRIVQELLSNLGKHALAENFLVRLRPMGSGHLISVSDDGVGLKESYSSKGMGFDNISERARKYNGEVHVLTRPAVDGTKITISLPAGDVEN